MKITITGGSGFLGSHVADALSREGHKVIIFDKKKSKWIRPDQEMRIGDILNVKALENAIIGSDIVFHFAALGDINQAIKNPLNTVNINILGTVHALELSRKHNIKRFIHASTIYVNSADGSFYRSSKKAAEDYVDEYKKIYGLNYTILRFGSLYGQRSDDTNGVKKVVKSAILTGKVNYYGSKKSIRKYIHVTDAAKACVDILKNKYKNKSIILTGKGKIKVSIFLKKLAYLLNISKKINFENKKYTGHYIVNPFNYKPLKGKRFVFKSTINFYDGLLHLISDIKKENNEKKFKKNN
jgi:UDP-glucose 4-epimerase|tara:strand:+ start:13839 stop:14732 length:894 start_codon:yes stop_codon:yes gene_type:complete